MYSEYHTYTLGELIPIINRAAMDLMTEPITAGKKADGTLMNMAEVANQNSLIAMNNAGIRLLAKALIEELSGQADEKEDDPDG